MLETITVVLSIVGLLFNVLALVLLHRTRRTLRQAHRDIRKIVTALDDPRCSTDTLDVPHIGAHMRYDATLDEAINVELGIWKTIHAAEQDWKDNDSDRLPG